MLYYTHVNEDNRVERDLLQKAGSSTVIAIAGSGERVISLLDCDTCSLVHVVDVNEEALFLLQLKLAALKVLTVEEYFKFCGHYQASKNERCNWFGRIKKELPFTCMTFWEKNIQLIETGILYVGHFEKFLQRIRPFVVGFLGRHFQLIFSKNIDIFLKFPKKRWNLLRHFFTFHWVYKFWGNKDLAFVSKDAAISYIPNALNKIFYKGETASCFMAHLIFKGHLREMSEENIPPSLQKDTLNKIKKRITASNIFILYHHTDLLSFVNEKKDILQMQPPIFYSLSDILSFENFNYLQQLIDKVTFHDNTTLVWRTFLRNRINVNSALQFPVVTTCKLQEHTSEESTRMYQVFSYQIKQG